MSLYKCIYENDYVKQGAFLEDIENGFVQGCLMEPDTEGCLRPFNNYGLLVPLAKVREFCIRIQNYGLDKRW